MNDITALTQRMEEVDPRDAFEKMFPLPAFCIRCGTGYASTSFNGWEAHKQQAKWEGWKAAMALMGSRAITVKLPALNDDLITILGRPNFTCAHLAELLRRSGMDIKRKSEHEQAAVIHWFLGLYLEHGEKWESVAKADIQARIAGIQVIEGDE